jgi:hypothetical protein
MNRVVPLAWLCLLAVPAAAQVSGTVDLGAGTYHPERGTPAGVASVAPALRYRGAGFDLDLAGTYTDAPARWNFQGAGSAAYRVPAIGPLGAELVGEADWTSHYRVRGTTSLTGLGRLTLDPGHGTRIWLGRGVGIASALGDRRAVRRTELGTRAQLAGVELGFTLFHSSFTLMGNPGESDSPSDTLGTQPGPRDSSALRSSLTDAVVTGRWRLGSLGFDASLGRRFGSGNSRLTLWGLSAYRGITPMLEVVASAGRSGSDPVTAVPGSRYFAMGLRFRFRGGPAPLAPPQSRPADRAGFHLGPALGAGREIVVRVARAHRVELAGDFTDWRPVSLEPWADGGWRTVLTIAPGLHRLAIRVDGGSWRAPPGLRPLASEFGGEVAELVVE